MNRLFLGKPNLSVVNYIKKKHTKKNLILKTISGNSYGFDAESDDIKGVFNYAQSSSAGVLVFDPYAKIPELANYENLVSIDDLDGKISSISHIDKCANLTSINFTNAKYIEHIYNSGLSTIQFDNVEYMADWAIYRNNNLTSINMPKLISASFGFTYCPNLEEINCSSLLSAGQNMVLSCDSLKTINFSNTRYLGNTAIAKCSNLSTVNISKCEKMGPGAFMECKNLKNIILSAVTEPTEINIYSLYACNSKYCILIYVKDSDMVNAFLANPTWNSLEYDHSLIYIRSIDEWKE